MPDRKKINSHHVPKSTTICLKRQSQCEQRVESDGRLNIRWIMYVGQKLHYTIKYLIDWCCGSEVQFLGSLFNASYSQQSLISTFQKKEKRALIFFPHALKSCEQALVYLSVPREGLKHRKEIEMLPVSVFVFLRWRPMDVLQRRASVYMLMRLDGSSWIRSNTKPMLSWFYGSSVATRHLL